jgi:glycosyltransferase involved in cell wall biosynthesis
MDSQLVWDSAPGMNNLNICHLFQSSGMDFSEAKGAQIHIYHTLRTLQEMGQNTLLLALQGRRVLFTDDLRIFQGIEIINKHLGKQGFSGSNMFKVFESGVRRIQREIKFPYFALFDSYRIYGACRQNIASYDILHERFNLLAFGGALASRKLGIPFVLEINADLLEQRKFKGTALKGIQHKFAEWTTRYCFSMANIIVCISKNLQEHLTERWGVPKDRLIVLPCAADVGVFSSNNNANKVRSGLGLRDEPVVMWIGGFYRWHDLNLVLDGFSTVVEQIPNVRLILVGDGETRSRVEQKVYNNNLKGVTIFTGSIPHAQIPDILSIADVVVSPAPSLTADTGGTGTPLKIFVFMAAGKAIVATETSQIYGVLQHGQNGMLVTPGEVEEFAQTIIWLLNHPSHRERIGNQALNDARKFHSWERYGNQLVEIYRSLLP